MNDTKKLLNQRVKELEKCTHDKEVKRGTTEPASLLLLIKKSGS